MCTLDAERDVSVFSRAKATSIVSMCLSVTCNTEHPPPPPSEKFAGRSRSDLKKISILLGFLDLENFWLMGTPPPPLGNLLGGPDLTSKFF